ncbi:MAG: VWA domain-containing protein [Acidobacteria bacterium]|nr:VWA domain-containing protein [Acidobacteriota bacterium]
MKKFVTVLVCLCFLGISVLAQSSGREKRPRIVTAPVPPPSTDSSNPNNRPPVLIGDKKTTQTSNTAEEPPVEDDEVIRIETNLVTFPVSVLDRNGRFISGLQKQDFQIFENGVEQKIDSFGSVEVPFTVILLLDVSPSTQYKIDEIQDAAITFVNQLRRDDKVIVISFDERVRVLSSATNNRYVLRDAIRQAAFGDGTSLYEAVDLVINQQLRSIEGRKAVVLFTDGVDTTSRRATYQSTMRETEEVDALFYPIRYDTYAGMQGGNGGRTYPRRRTGGGTLGDLIGIILGGGNIQIGGGNYPSGGGSAGSSREEYETGRRYLEELARNSGGRIFEADTTYNLDAAFSGIAEELRRQYTLGYYPETIGQKGERKQIRVRVKRPNLVVRAKNSYIVGENNNKFAGK